MRSRWEGVHSVSARCAGRYYFGEVDSILFRSGIRRMPLVPYLSLVLYLGGRFESKGCAASRCVRRRGKVAVRRGSKCQGMRDFLWEKVGWK